MLVTHVQLTAAREDVDRCVVKDQLHWLGELQVLNITYEPCPGA